MYAKMINVNVFLIYTSDLLSDQENEMQKMLLKWLQNFALLPCLPYCYTAELQELPETNLDFTDHQLSISNS